jgi:hypothetical protein
VIPNVAVVVPIYRTELSPSERLSLRSLRHHLGEYPHIGVMPDGLSAAPAGFSVQHFPARHFTARHKYSELLVSQSFYQAFERYTHILVYQLDCLVFSDQLRQWCARDYDYVGAPWVHCNEVGEFGFSGVGNGGFSLRNVNACIRVLKLRDAARHWSEPLAVAGGFTRRVMGSAARGATALLRGELTSFWDRSRRAVRFAALDAPPQYRNEDLFWGAADRLDPAFRIAPPQEAVSFAFEAEPRFCFEQNSHRLPFGCHQWQAYDAEFWRPYLAVATGELAC